MWFFKKETEADKIAKEKQAATVAALNSGDIPPIARERIMREKNMGKNFFSSDLSCREYLLTRELGVQTLGQVMGTSFFRVGIFGFGFNNRQNWTGEVSAVTETQINARKLAVSRLQTEAKLLGADGVIGVRIKKNMHAWGGGLTEFTAIGTAIKIPGWPQTDEPFTSTLNGQEFWQLYKAGYMPRGLVLGVSAYYMYTDPDTRKLITTWWGRNATNNVELQVYTQGFYKARHLAMSRLEAQIKELGADGAVDMDVDPGLQVIEYEINDTSYHDLLLNFVALGTAVKKGPAPKAPIGNTLVCLNLSTKTFGRLGTTDSYDDYDYQGSELMDSSDEGSENYEE